MSILDYRNLSPDQWSRKALIEEVMNLREELSRARGSVNDLMTRGEIARGTIKAQERVIVATKKAKGKMDDMAWRFVKRQLEIDIVSNVLGIPIPITAALMTDQFTWFMVLQAFMTAVIGPFQMYLQKKSEHHG